jgi:hypothetical protein
MQRGSDTKNPKLVYAERKEVILNKQQLEYAEINEMIHNKQKHYCAEIMK